MLFVFQKGPGVFLGQVPKIWGIGGGVSMPDLSETGGNAGAQGCSVGQSEGT